MTATLGESSVSKDVEVKDSYVASIELTCKEALTDADGKTAFIYYDVKNQYGESVRSSENIEWNTSPAKTSVDKASGKITIKKEVVDPEDVEMLQDLIITCVNEALRKVDSAQAASLGKYNIPGLM